MWSLTALVICECVCCRKWGTSFSNLVVNPSLKNIMPSQHLEIIRPQWRITSTVKNNSDNSNILRLTTSDWNCRWTSQSCCLSVASPSAGGPLKGMRRQTDRGTSGMLTMVQLEEQLCPFSQTQPGLTLNWLPADVRLQGASNVCFVLFFTLGYINKMWENLLHHLNVDARTENRLRVTTKAQSSKKTQLAVHVFLFPETRFCRVISKFKLCIWLFHSKYCKTVSNVMTDNNL